MGLPTNEDIQSCQFCSMSLNVTHYYTFLKAAEKVWKDLGVQAKSKLFSWNGNQTACFMCTPSTRNDFACRRGFFLLFFTLMWHRQQANEYVILLPFNVAHTISECDLSDWISMCPKWVLGVFTLVLKAVLLWSFLMPAENMACGTLMIWL